MTARGAGAVGGVAGAVSGVDDIGSVDDDRCWVPGNVDSFMTRQTFQPIRAIPATVSVHSSTLNQPLRSGVGWFVVGVPDRADHPARVTDRDGMIAHSTRTALPGVRRVTGQGEPVSVILQPVEHQRKEHPGSFVVHVMTDGRHLDEPAPRDRLSELPDHLRGAVRVVGAVARAFPGPYASAR